MFAHAASDDYAMSLSEAADYIQSVTGRRPSSATLYRWTSKGVRRVRLESHSVGGRIYTGRRAVDAFLEATNHALGLPAEKRSPLSVPELTNGLQARVQAQRASREAELRVAATEQAKQALRRKLNLFKLVLSC